MPMFDRPELKVQKDRRVCRLTDARMAKYSRRVMLFTIMVFFIAVTVGELPLVAPQLTLVLAIGLILLSLLHGYHLFRFGSLYAAGPHRWRRRYFFTAILFAGWWGLILVCHEWLLGFAPETHFLWLYTVMYSAIVVTVFAPYYRFLTWCLVVSLVPASATSFLSGDILGTVYGVLSLAFVWLISRQARLESENYWGRMGAMQELQQRASQLAVASKRSDAAIELTNEFVANIGQEFRSQLTDSLGALALLEAEQLPERQREWVRLAKNASRQQLKLVDNVGLFTRVARKSIRLRQGPFNLVKTVEKSFKFAAKASHRQRLEFNFEIDDKLPVMVIGDNRKTSQLIRNLVEAATAIAQQGEIWGQVDFSPISTAEGQMTIALMDDGQGEILPDESELFGAFSRVDSAQVATGLGLSIAKGLAEAMGGYLQLHSSRDGNRYQVAMRFATEPNQRFYLVPDRRLQDLDILLLHQKGLFVSGLEKALSSFGMEVQGLKYTSSAHRPALEEAVQQALVRSQLVLLVPAMGDSSLLTAVQEIIDHSDVEPKNCPLMCLGAYGHKQAFTPFIKSLPCTQYLSRPATRKELHDALIGLLFCGGKKTSRRIVTSSGAHPRQYALLLIEESRQHQRVTEEMLHTLGYRVEVARSVVDALELLSEGHYDMLLVDCQQNTEHSAQIIETLRHWESEHAVENRLPIIALTSTTEEQFEGRCLAAGMDDFLTKPLGKDQLRETIECWLGSARD
ncbi:hybrid sensor histidine kinase/response regulator [Microbulbifer sp. 2201CG32-9]|uniref:hybrid sensor histidine kinase/response regulator n=1 Tax=Microbulbifer sp. 2201CG32-9 TaxID=3232309 RepID=UPI00345C3DAE